MTESRRKVNRSSSAATQSAPEASPAIESYINNSRGAGQPLPASTRAYFEPRFGLDLHSVRVHTDDRAAHASREISAQAFTYGSDIYFGSEQYQPGTTAGDKLIAHELAHVKQQGAGTFRKIARQSVLEAPQIPDDLKVSLHVRAMTNQELNETYDRLLEVLNRFDISTPETAGLEEQMARISNELARRFALEHGRTFDDRAIERMKEYLVKNAKTERDSCIICMNKAIRLVLDDPNQQLTPESVDATMELLQASGRAGDMREIGFNDARGRLTRGGGRPHQLRESVSGALFEMVGKDVGWSVFGLSLMDADHSVTLTVDTNDPSNPKIYWSDQWKSKKGWKEYTREGLDQEITRLIQGWWDKQAEGKKHTLVVRLWRLRQ